MSTPLLAFPEMDGHTGEGAGSMQATQARTMVTGPAVIDLRDGAPVVVPHPVGRPTPFPYWLHVVESVRGSDHGRASLLTDTVVAVAAGIALRLPLDFVAVVAALLLFGFQLGRVYVTRSPIETQGVLWYPQRVAMPLTAVVLAAVVVAPQLDATPADALVLGGFLAVALFGVRVAGWGVLAWARRRGVGLLRAVVVGSGEMARTVVRTLETHIEAGLRPVGIVSPDGERESGMGVGLGALPADLPAIIRHHHIRHVVLVAEGNHDIGVAECLELCDGLDTTFSLLPPLADLFLRPTLVTQVGGLPLIPLGRVTRTRSTLPGKRVFDVVAAAAVLLVVWPVALAAALAIKLGDRGPILYRQRRVGLGGEPFDMLKFRSMVVDADRRVEGLSMFNVTDGLLFKMHDDPRITRVGRVLRRLSIDELPQLWNVLRGEMSIIGPRPLPVDPDEFGALDGKRHSVPPGITGYWQVAGGTGLTYQEMVKLDLAYIQDWSFWLDVQILLRTLPALLNRHRWGPT